MTSLYANGPFVPPKRKLFKRRTVSLQTLACQLICFYRRCQARNGCHIQFGQQGPGSYHCWWGMDKLRYFLKLLCEMCKRFLCLNYRIVLMTKKSTGLFPDFLLSTITSNDPWLDSLLRATRGAHNPNIQVAIAHARFLCNHPRLGFHKEWMEFIKRNLIRSILTT